MRKLEMKRLSLANHAKEENENLLLIRET